MASQHTGAEPLAHHMKLASGTACSTGAQHIAISIVVVVLSLLLLHSSLATTLPWPASTPALLRCLPAPTHAQLGGGRTAAAGQQTSAEHHPPQQVVLVGGTALLASALMCMLLHGLQLSSRQLAAGPQATLPSPSLPLRRRHALAVVVAWSAPASARCSTSSSSTATKSYYRYCKSNLFLGSGELGELPLKL